MPAKVLKRADETDSNRKTLLVLLGIIAFLVAVSVITILVKN